MSRIQDIFARARDTLNDSDAERWSDEALLRLLDEGQKDIATQIEVFKDIIVVPLRTGEHTYSLPEDTISILKVTFRARKLPLTTTEFMNRQGLTGQVLSSIRYTPTSDYIRSSRNSHWMSTITGDELIFCIYDKIKRHRLRVWPTPISEELEELITELENDYGITTDVELFSMLGQFGVISSVIDTDEIVTEYDPDELGILSEVYRRSSLVIYRTKTSETVTSVHDSLEIDPCWDNALKHYVVGKAFRNDLNVANRQIGNEELTFYSRELDRLSKVASQESVSGDHFDSMYDGMGY